MQISYAVADLIPTIAERFRELGSFLVGDEFSPVGTPMILWAQVVVIVGNGILIGATRKVVMSDTIKRIMDIFALKPQQDRLPTPAEAGVEFALLRC